MIRAILLVAMAIEVGVLVGCVVVLRELFQMRRDALAESGQGQK